MIRSDPPFVNIKSMQHEVESSSHMHFAVLARRAFQIKLLCLLSNIKDIFVLSFTVSYTG